MIAALGANVWLAMAIGASAWLLVTFVAGPKRLPGLLDVLGAFLGCWAGRIFMLALWSEAGWHLFTEHP